ncbi:hypothetical protein E4U82_10200 [Lentibacillus salicampi]|uniref:Uncharacterized protein n=1 Tax=Lentibacillus salicampi TaxID=175306 RepID=A0A4Y9AAL4_9BACI|nr:hypothetical protein E4U82_10200 [Lentibacillus salicampi]
MLSIIHLSYLFIFYQQHVIIEDFDEFVYCLNTVGEYNIIRWDDISKKEVTRYTTFDEYLQDSFQEAIDNLD